MNEIWRLENQARFLNILPVNIWILLVKQQRCDKWKVLNGAHFLVKKTQKRVLCWYAAQPMCESSPRLYLIFSNFLVIF